MEFIASADIHRINDEALEECDEVMAAVAYVHDDSYLISHILFRRFGRLCSGRCRFIRLT